MQNTLDCFKVLVLRVQMWLKLWLLKTSLIHHEAEFKKQNVGNGVNKGGRGEMKLSHMAVKKDVVTSRRRCDAEHLSFCILREDEHNTSLNGLLGSEGWRGTSAVYITGPGVDWKVTRPVRRHLTNINPISLKDWTLCLHMGPEWDDPVQKRLSDQSLKWHYKSSFIVLSSVSGPGRSSKPSNTLSSEETNVYWYLMVLLMFRLRAATPSTGSNTAIIFSYWFRSSLSNNKPNRLMQRYLRDPVHSRWRAADVTAGCTMDLHLQGQVYLLQTLRLLRSY